MTVKEIVAANGEKQLPLHFIVPSQKYKEPGVELIGYKSHQKEALEMTKVLKVNYFNGPLFHNRLGLISSWIVIIVFYKWVKNSCGHDQPLPPKHLNTFG